MRIGDSFEYNGKKVVIIDKIKGRKTNKPNMQSGCLLTGYKSNRVL